MAKHRKNNKWYLLYKGDDFLCQGHIETLEEYLGCKRKTILHYASPSYKKSNKMTPTSYVVYHADLSDD